MERKYIEAEIRNDYRKLTELLIKRKLTITTMESATSGQIASLITDTEGASAIFKGAFITYCNEAKLMQGVPAEIIDKYSVYSRETAAAMAKACATAYKSDIGLGVTGTMGNVDTQNADYSTPGQIYYAIDYKGVSYTYFVEIKPLLSRLEYKLAAAREVYESLIQLLC